MDALAGQFRTEASGSRSNGRISLSPPITFLTTSHAVSVTLEILLFPAFSFLASSHTLSGSLAGGWVHRGSGALAEKGEAFHAFQGAHE
jgi:hypothetical protein